MAVNEQQLRQQRRREKSRVYARRHYYKTLVRMWVHCRLL